MGTYCNLALESRCLELQNLLLFGDSITAGQYVPPSDRFTEKLRHFFYKESYNLGFDVLAVSGQTTRQALLCFPGYINEYKVDYLLVQLGINDANYWQSEGGLHPRVSSGAFRENVLEIIERAKLAGVQQVRLVTNHSINKLVYIDDDFFQLNKFVSDYNQIVKDVAGRFNKSVAVYDLAKLWEELPQDLKIAALLPDDGVHLSSIGHEFYFNCLKEFLLKDGDIELA